MLAESDIFAFSSSNTTFLKEAFLKHEVKVAHKGHLCVVWKCQDSNCDHAVTYAILIFFLILTPQRCPCYTH